MHLSVDQGDEGHLVELEREFEDADDESLQARSQDSGSGGELSSPGSRGSGGCIRDRPVKVIPCPRCQSMNTKFCYYNNYSVNQPRHFCRNCQRYWTVGGTLRNVPVGGGSRKKNRSRQRSDTYIRAGAPGSNQGIGLPNPLQTVSNLQQLSMLQPQATMGMGFGNQYPQASQIPFLQYAMEQSQGAYNPLLSKALVSHQQEAELQAFYEAQSNAGLMSNPPGMTSGGMYYPEVEGTQGEALGSVMQKAEMWNAHAQQLQNLNRLVQQANWESKPSLSSHEVPQNVAEERRSHMNGAVPHHKPGFWETALMHSRPVMSKRPGSHTWDENQSTQTNVSPHGSSTIEEEGSTPTNGYSHNGYAEDASSWGLNSDLYLQ